MRLKAAICYLGHAFINNWDIPKAIKSLGEKLISLHIHDNNGDVDEHLPVNMGKIDLPPIWEELICLPTFPNLVLEYNKTSLYNILESAKGIEVKFSNIST